MADEELEGTEVTSRRRPSSQIHATRAAVIVGCFVAATILLLGPATNRSNGATPTVTTTTLHHAPPPRVVRSRVSVQVANSTSAPHLGAHYSQYLSTQGWNSLPAVDTNGTHPAHSIVYFNHGFQLAARMIARELGLQPSTAVMVMTANTGVSNAAAVDVVVVLGPDLELTHT
jgi:hypothetical protein